jgi:hypothetical protein
MIITKSQLRRVIREEVQKIREASKNSDDNFIVKYGDKKANKTPAAIAHDKTTKKSAAQKSPK